MSISFEVGEELQAIVEAVHGFAEDRIRPGLRDFEAQRGLPDELRQECHELGVSTLVLPESLGGLDLLDLRAAALCVEELAWGDLGAAVAIPGPGLAGALVLEAADEGTQQTLLAPFADEEQGWRLRGAAALVEGPFGISPAAIETVAYREREGWALSGAKRYVPNAAEAELTVVLARVEGAQAADPWDAMGLFAASGRAGLVAGERQDRLGLDAASYGDLTLEQTPVQRLDAGRPGQVRAALRRAIARAKLLDAARLVGATRAASEYAFQYATERKTFGVHLYEHQALAFMMADMATLVDGMRTLVWEAAWRHDRGEDAYPAALRAFRQVSQQAVEVASDAVQVLGGHGYLWDHPVEKWMRDVRTLGLVDGLTDEEAELSAALA